MLFEHTCDQQRNKAIGTNGRHRMSNVATGLRCLFLPLSTNAELQQGFSIGRGWSVYFPGTPDIKVGDRLIYDGALHAVSSVRAFKTRRLQHLEVMAQREVR